MSTVHFRWIIAFNQQFLLCLPVQSERAWRWYQKTAWQGRSRASTRQQDRYLRALGKEEQEQHHQSPPTGYRCACFWPNRLHEDGMRAWRPLVEPVLTAQHCAAWLAFAREHQKWQVVPWLPVLFTDESRFALSTCDRRERGWRSCGERYAACNIIQHDRLGSGSVRVWGGISLEGGTDLSVIANGTLTAVRWNPQRDCQTWRWCSGLRVPPGAGQCPASCGPHKCIQARGGHTHYWVALWFFFALIFGVVLNPALNGSMILVFTTVVTSFCSQQMFNFNNSLIKIW